jgi:hypothetical protein
MAEGPHTPCGFSSSLERILKSQDSHASLEAKPVRRSLAKFLSRSWSAIFSSALPGAQIRRRFDFPWLSPDAEAALTLSAGVDIVNRCRSFSKLEVNRKFALGLQDQTQACHALTGRELCQIMPPVWLAPAGPTDKCTCYGVTRIQAATLGTRAVSTMNSR